MELNRALELAVVSSWDELVSPGAPCLVHVEYQNVPGLPVNLLEVWMIKNHGYGTLVCRRSMSRTDSPSLDPWNTSRCIFANSYGSKTLAGDLDFIMRNQGHFSRKVDHSIHGLVHIDTPTDDDKETAAIWSRSDRRAFPVDSAIE